MILSSNKTQIRKNILIFLIKIDIFIELLTPLLVHLLKNYPLGVMLLYLTTIGQSILNKDQTFTSSLSWKRLSMHIPNQIVSLYK